MKKVLTTSVMALMLCAHGVSQTKRSPKSKKSTSSTSLTAQEIARRSLPSVVVLIGRDTNGKAITLGTGFFLTPRIIATNLHVIEDASQVTVKLLTGDRSEYAIEGSVAIDEENDLALLQVNIDLAYDDLLDSLSRVPQRQPLPLARETRPAQIGDAVYAVGNPEGYEGTFSPGIISAFRDTDYIQITAPISPGSSGGPVMNHQGKVIGVATAYSKEGQNLNFAIPVSRLISLLGRVTTARPLRPRAVDGEYDDVINSLGAPTPTATPRPQARTESLVSESDTLFVRWTSARTEGVHTEDTRKYRFHLTESAHVKGRFSTQGGKIYMQIFSGGVIIYSSGNISSDSIEKTLPSGTYEVVVSLIDPGAVSFSVELTAFYDQ